jgi:acetone carboxylase gamma subunit
MKTMVDQRLRSEATRYRLRFACPDCAYFDFRVGSCAEGYPVEEHLRTDLERSDLLFCKLFEMA